MGRSPGVWRWVAVLGLSVAAWASPPRWLEVESPHFHVLSDSSAKDAQKVAVQLERMRIVFHRAFPKLAVDPPVPIEVLALKDGGDFKTIEPAPYLAKHSATLAGFFMRGQARNYIAMRLDVSHQRGYEEMHPYATIYHEYTHLLTAKAEGYMPLWLTEGLAEFYQNTLIERKDAAIGEPDANNVMILRQTPLMPLPTLFKVGYNSPYYHEDDKVSIFYAESWALTHYLMTQPHQGKVTELDRYLALMQRHADAVAAARAAFGDLGQLQEKLTQYAGHPAFRFFKMSFPAAAQHVDYPEHAVALAQANAVRADFMAEAGRLEEAAALAQTVVKQDPQNSRAYETLGEIAERRGERRQALQWYRRAVGLNADDYWAQYYFGSETLRAANGAGGMDTATRAQVFSSLARAIHLNPGFAPAWDALAIAEGQELHNFELAHVDEVKAIELDPGEAGYRENMANILVEMDRIPDALAVAKTALPLARNAAERQQVQSVIQYVRERRREEAVMRGEEAAASQPKEAELQPGAVGGGSTAGRTRRAGPGSSGSSSGAAAPGVPAGAGLGSARQPTGFSGGIEKAIMKGGAATFAVRTKPVTRKGPLHFYTGIVGGVRCSGMAMKVDLLAPGGELKLHSSDYAGVKFTAKNFTPHGMLLPCTEMKGYKAEVAAADHEIVAIELIKVNRGR